MTWYDSLSEEFFSSHIRSTKQGKEAAQEAFENALRAVGSTVMSTVVSTLLEDSLPGDIVWKTGEKEYTADEMRRHLKSASPEGQQFSIDLLRVSKDLILRAAASHRKRT